MDIFYLYIDEYFYNNRKRLREYNAGRFIIKYAAKNFYNIKNAELEIVNNKPKFKYSTVCFSISHSNNIAAVCFDNYETGFDIEYKKERKYEEIAKRMKFELKEKTLEEFYKNWTIYEAQKKLQKKPRCTITSSAFDNYIFSISSAVREKIEYNLIQI